MLAFVRMLVALLLIASPLLAQQKPGKVVEDELPPAKKGGEPVVYATYLATSVKADAKPGLMLALHGGRGTARQFAGFLAPAAEAEGALLVCAQGFEEIVGADGYWWKGDSKEMAALDRLVEHVRATYEVDPARFTVIGLADGAELAIKWAVEKDRGVTGVIAVNFLWKRPGAPVAPKTLKFCLIASRDAKEKLVSLAEEAEKTKEALERAKYQVVLRIVPGSSRSFFHGWEKEFRSACAWFEGRLDWPKELAEAESRAK